ncbi:MAG: hypothetical protein V7776_23050 [Halopseudomonas aestusnigri]
MPSIKNCIEAPDGVKLPNNPVIHHIFLKQIEKAAAIVSEAELRANKILSQSVEINENARKEGFKEGHDEGVLQGVSEIAVLIKQLDEERLSMAGEMVVVVESCIMRLLGSTPPKKKITSLVSQAILEVNEMSALAVCVSSRSKERLLGEVGTDQMKIIIGDHELNVEEDTGLSDEDCLIVYPREIVDARLEIRLNALIAVVKRDWLRNLGVSDAPL